MNFLKKLIEYTCLTVATAGMAIGLGLNIVNEQAKIDEETVSARYSSFNYMVSGASKAQVQEIKNYDCVDDIFPFYNFNIDITGKKMNKINLLLSESLDSSKITFFNDDTLMDGQFDENKVMLDHNAANELGVKVGDNLHLSLANKDYTIAVAGIYYKSTYAGFDEGLGLMKMTSAMLNDFQMEPQYAGLFVKANNVDKFKSEMKDYHPLALFVTEEKFIENYKHNNTCPPDKTEEEWVVQIKGFYQEALDNFKANNHSSYVKEKQSLYVAIENNAKDKTASLSSMVLLNAVIPSLVFGLASIAFVFINNKGDVKDAKRGTTLGKMMGVNVGIALGFGVIALAAVALAIELIGKGIAIYPETFASIAVPTIFPFIIALFVAVLANTIYVAALYHKTKIKN